MFLHSIDKTFESVIEHESDSYEEFYEKFILLYTFSIGIETCIVGVGFMFNRQLGYIHDMITQHYVEFIHEFFGIFDWSFLSTISIRFASDVCSGCEKNPREIIT